MTTQNELVSYEEKTVIQCLSGKDGLDPLIAEVTQAVNSFEHDMGTATSRAKTASLAHRVSKFKTAIDGMGKDLVSDWKIKAKAVDVNRKAMRDAMDALKIEARKPLDEWEAEQAKIEAEAAAKIEAEKLAVKKESDHEIAVLRDREYDRLLKEAEEEEARFILEAQEEMARLKLEAQEKAAREQKERDDLIAKEAAEKARQAEEAKRIESENKAKLEAEAAAKREADAKAALQKAEDDRIAAEAKAKQDAIDAEARQAQAVKDAEARTKLEAEVKRLAEEREAKAREEDVAHRASVDNAALAVIMDIGISKEHGKELLKRVHDRLVPSVTISY